MSVKDNGNMLGLEPMGMSHLLRTEKKPLTNQGAAEYYWSMSFEIVMQTIVPTNFLWVLK